jgi:uncharacterized RDD family membrane protein YckC
MAELVTGEAVALDLRVARLASRACALLLDMLLQMVMLTMLLYLVGTISIIADPAWSVGFAIVGVLVIILGYPLTFESLSRGRTLGKMALGLRVVADDGGPVRFRQVLVRALVAVPEIWLLSGAAALITSLFNPQAKRLGDLFAGTVVIQERVPTAMFGGPVAIMPPELAGWGQALELSQLPDGLALTARQYLTRFWELLPEVRDIMGVRIADQVLAVVTPPPPRGFRPEIVLSAVLAERRRREEWRLAQRQARRMRVLFPGWRPATGYPVPAMAVAGAPPVPVGAGGPPMPPPFSAPGPGQPRFLPPAQYTAGPYAQVLTPQPQPHPGWPAQPHPAGYGPPQPAPWPTAGQPPPNGPPQRPPAGYGPPEGG